MNETTPAIQDYLGAIYDLAGTDKPVIGARLARHMHVSAPSITEALAPHAEGRLRPARRPARRSGSPPKGSAIAETMARRHRLIERWLTDVLGLDWSRAHDEAHRLEHALSPVVEERLAETPRHAEHLSPRQSDPGHARPPRPTARSRSARPPRTTRSWSSASPRKRRRIASPCASSGRAAIRPGSRIVVSEIAPYAGTVSIVLEGRTVTMGISAANKIWVYDPPRGRPTARKLPRALAPRQVPPRLSMASKALYALQNGFLGFERAGLFYGDRSAERVAHPGHLLPRTHRRRDHPLRHRHLAARGAGPPAPGSPLPLQRRGSPGAPARLDRARAQGRGSRRPQPTCTSTTRVGPPSSTTSEPVVQKDEYAYAHYPAAFFASYYYRKNFDLPGLPLAPARRRHRAGPGRDRAAQRRPHPRGTSRSWCQLPRHRTRDPGRRIPATGSNRSTKRMALRRRRTRPWARHSIVSGSRRWREPRPAPPPTRSGLHPVGPVSQVAATLTWPHPFPSP